MLQKIASLLQGTVRVRASSRFPERVLNVCSARGIPFTDPAFLGGEELAFSVRRSDWRSVRAACADIGASVHIETVAGLPFALGRLRRRRVLLAGLALCAVLLAVNSCFIWDFQVEGCRSVPQETVLRVLAQNGVRRGAFAFSFDQQELRNRALLELPRLAWLTVNVRGCRATVIVRERVPKPEIANESAPTNVTAKRDALVTSVQALDGRALVLPGSVVHRGQLLISGVVETDGVEQPVVASRFLAGKGEVRGRTWYELSVKLPLFTERKIPTGQETVSRAVLWGEKRLKFKGKDSGNFPMECDKIISRKQWALPGGYLLPVCTVTERARPFVTERRSRSREETQALGQAALETYLRTLLGAEGEILSCRAAGAVQGDWLLVTISAECSEQIGVVVPIEVQ